MKDKIICIDLDNTIINTSKTIINLHNKLNPQNQYNYTDKIDWKFKPIIKTNEELSELFKLFDHKDFYKDVVVFPNAIEYINKLAETNKILICSKHCESRKKLTKAWINKVMPKVEVIFVDNFQDKGNIECDIVIDDRLDSLDSFSDDVLKLCYGIYEWNRHSDYYEIYDWYEIEYLIKNDFFDI